MATPVAATITLAQVNPSNTAILDPDDKFLYTVHTTHSKATATHVLNADEEELASLDWRDVLPDKVTLGNRASTSLRDWLHTSPVPSARKGECHDSMHVNERI